MVQATLLPRNFVRLSHSIILFIYDLIVETASRDCVTQKAEIIVHNNVQVKSPGLTEVLARYSRGWAEEKPAKLRQDTRYHCQNLNENFHYTSQTLYRLKQLAWLLQSA